MKVYREKKALEAAIEKAAAADAKAAEKVTKVVGAKRPASAATAKGEGKASKKSKEAPAVAPAPAPAHGH
jgi:hypothetical protein